MATFNSGGLALAYDDIRPAGEASGTVLMVHGFATSRAENWRAMASSHPASQRIEAANATRRKPRLRLISAKRHPRRREPYAIGRLL